MAVIVDEEQRALIAGQLATVRAVGDVSFDPTTFEVLVRAVRAGAP